MGFQRGEMTQGLPGSRADTHILFLGEASQLSSGGKPVFQQQDQQLLMIRMIVVEAVDQGSHRAPPIGRV